MVLAEAQATVRHRPADYNADNLWTRGRLRAPVWHGLAYSSPLGLPAGKVFVAWQPPPSAWLRWSRPATAGDVEGYYHVVDGLADVLPRAFAELAMAMRKAVTDQRS